jgi:hypothetical protein
MSVPVENSGRGTLVNTVWSDVPTSNYLKKQKELQKINVTDQDQDPQWIRIQEVQKELKEKKNVAVRQDN